MNGIFRRIRVASVDAVETFGKATHSFYNKIVDNELNAPICESDFWIASIVVIHTSARYADITLTGLVQTEFLCLCEPFLRTKITASSGQTEAW